tara:strand:- start:187 stop:759 length:573 start_codon:yes stop_codon:yes gene_type:complete
MKELIAIQSELKAPKGQYNKFGKYNYRSCEDILEAVKPLLAEHNAFILITDEVKGIGDHIYIEAIVEFRVGDKGVQVKAQAGINPDRKGMDVAQSYGSSSSYARKYALAGLLLLDDTKDADTKDNSEENEFTVDAKKLRLHLENIVISPDLDSLRLANVQAYKFAEGDQDALSAILKAKNARKKELTENE